MQKQLLKIAELTYSIPSSVELTSNYLPFLLSSDEGNSQEEFTSVMVVGEMPKVTEQLCHTGVVIDPEKELSIYTTEGTEKGYHVVLRAQGSKDVYELYASPTWNKIILSDTCANSLCPPSVIDIFMMLVFIYSAASFHTILLHASTVKKGEGAVAFIGQSGAGKSTHSQLWLQYVPGTTLLNDDQPAVRIFEQGEVLIYGTPWSGKTSCYVNDSGLLKGIIRMQQASYNKITPLNPLSMFCELLSSCSMIKEDPVTFKQITATLALLSAHIPGFILENKPELKAVEMAYSNILKGNYKKEC